MVKDMTNASTANERTDFRWTLPQDSDTVYIEGRDIGSDVWAPAAEISLSEARVTHIHPRWENDPALFDICNDVCRDICAEAAA